MILGGSTAESTEPRAERLELSSIDVAGLSKSELHDLILASEEAARQAKADLYELCAEAKCRKGPSFDQHRNESLWLADSLRMAKGTAGGILKRGALMFRTHPEIGQAFRAGTIGDHHLDLFMRIWNKPALRPFLARDLAALIGFASYDWFDCRALFVSWEVLVDPIDPNEYAERAYADRALSYTDGVQQQVIMEILTSTAVFASVEPALNAIVDEMFKADWADAQARVGDDATMDDLIRTDTQRRHDAFFRLVRNGIGADPTTANLVTNVVVDDETLADEAQRRDNQHHDNRNEAGDNNGGDNTGSDSRSNVKTGDENTDDDGRGDDDRGDEAGLGGLSVEDVMRRVRRRRCETEFGRPISPADALDFAIAGHLRLFVMNTKTRDFEASSKQRLFSRTQRLGFLIRDRHCQGPGCDTAAVHCQADHVVRHTDGGKTVPVNGEPECDPCHRHKTRLENLGLWPPGP